MEELTEVCVDGLSYQMSITTQPPLKTVYQRILKPFPTVTLTLQNPQSKSQRAGNDRRRSRRRSQPDTDDEEQQQAEKKPTTVKTEKAENEEIDADYADVLETLNANSSNSSSNGLFVEATLLRGDNGEPIPKCLDGNCIVRFEKNPWSEGVYTATFKKLKILSTSQQLQGVLFRLMFTLKKYSGNSFASVLVEDCSVASHPIEVFSHSQYLTNKKPVKGNSTSPRKDLKDSRKLDDKKVNSSLISVIQAYKEQGGSKTEVLDVVNSVYGDDDGSVLFRRMSAPAYLNSHPQLLIPPALPPVGLDTSISNVEFQFVSDLLTKLQIGAITLDEYVAQLIQGVGRPRAMHLLQQLGYDIDSLIPLNNPFARSLNPTTTLPPMSSTAPLPMDSSNSLATLLNALAQQQLAQLTQQSQMGIANQLLQQQLMAAASVPVVPKPRRPSQPQVNSPTSTSLQSTTSSQLPSPDSLIQLPPLVVPTKSATGSSSASSSLSTLADAISSHLQKQQPEAANATSSSVIDLTAGSTLAASSLSSASAPAPSPLSTLFSLSSLASAMDAPAEPNRGRKRSLSSSDVTTSAPSTVSGDQPPSPKQARHEGDADVSGEARASPSSSSSTAPPEKVQWYWKNNATWEPYAENVSYQLEMCHKSQIPCVVVLHDVPYKMDFQTMTQQRVDNPKRFKHIRRGEN